MPKRIPNIDKLRKVTEEGYQSVTFTNGDKKVSRKVDAFTASAVVKVYDVLSETAQPKAAEMVESWAGFQRFAEFAFKNLK